MYIKITFFFRKGNLCYFRKTYLNENVIYV